MTYDVILTSVMSSTHLVSLPAAYSEKGRLHNGAVLPWRLTELVESSHFSAAFTSLEFTDGQ